MKKDSLIIFFDFECGLCTKVIYTLQKLDKKKIFLFAPIKGITWEDLRITSPKDSVLVIKNGKFYWEFSAIRIILQNLPIFWSIWGYISYLIPSFVGNFLYRWIAKKRKNVSCPLTPVDKIYSQQFLPTLVPLGGLLAELFYSNFVPM